MIDKRVLDPCCGGRMFYFDKENTDVVFGDIRHDHQPKQADAENATRRTGNGFAESQSWLKRMAGVRI